MKNVFLCLFSARSTRAGTGVACEFRRCVHFTTKPREGQRRCVRYDEGNGLARNPTKRTGVACDVRDNQPLRIKATGSAADADARKPGDRNQRLTRRKQGGVAKRGIGKTKTTSRFDISARTSAASINGHAVAAMFSVACADEGAAEESQGLRNLRRRRTAAPPRRTRT